MVCVLVMLCDWPGCSTVMSPKGRLNIFYLVTPEPWAALPASFLRRRTSTTASSLPWTRMTKWKWKHPSLLLTSFQKVPSKNFIIYNMLFRLFYSSAFSFPLLSQPETSDFAGDNFSESLKKIFVVGYQLLGFLTFSFITFRSVWFYHCLWQDNWHCPI